MAILSNPYFNAQQVDAATVTLGDEQGTETPVVRKKRGDLLAVYRDIDRDGDTDLVLTFDPKELIANGDLSAGATRLLLLGKRNDGRVHAALWRACR